MKRLLAFGDSVMKGVYYSDELNKYKLYGERFASLRAKGFEVRNCSVMGATVDNAGGLIDKWMSTNDSSDDVTAIFEYGGNDCDYDWNAVSESPDGTFFPHTPYSDFIAKYGSAIQKAKNAGAKIFVCNLVPIESTRYFEWIARKLNRNNIISWLGDESMLYRWQEFYSHSAEKIASEYDCGLIDIRSPFLLSHHYRDLLSSDGIHPTPTGHMMIDEAISSALLA